MAAAASSGRAELSIGQVLQALRPDFPDVSISKLRFLEAEGLISPQRAPSGYRRFSAADVERVRYILTAQRDHYYPLRVIKTHLEALARGLEPPDVAGGLPRVPPQSTDVPAGHAPVGMTEPSPRELSLSWAELLANSGLDDDQLDQLVSFGLIRARQGREYFGQEALLVATTVAKLATYGLEARHLRAVKTSVDRELGLIEHVLSPLRRQSRSGSSEPVRETASELTELCLRLHAALLRGSLAIEPQSLERRKSSE